MELRDYLAKPDKTIEKHTNDLLNALEELNELGYIKDKEIYILARKACYYHDFGKANKEFQKRVSSKDKKLKFNLEKEIFHNILSVYFIDPNDFECKEDYYRVCHGVLNHHNYCEDPGVYITSNKALIAKTLDEFNIFEIKRSNLKKILNIKDDARSIIIKGLLHKCDYSASADYVIEYKNDFLEKSMNNLLSNWKEKNNKASWNDLQEFCLDNKDNNIIAIAQTGMGKTEGGLLWLGDSKGFFVLPIRTAINAIYDRVRINILENKNIMERVSILHSSSMEYYNKNIPQNEEVDIFEYNKRGRQLSMPLSISTMDQLFDFVLKYQGYELKLTTLSYSKIVIDEIQMYGPDLLAYLIYGIKLINKFGGKIAILTATLPPFIKDLLKEIPFSFGVFTNDIIRHNVEVKDEMINCEDILKKYEENKKYNKSNKILVICNTINKAQELYEKLYETMDKEDRSNLNILHSRFIKKDRSKRESEILECGKTYNEDGTINAKNSIWISTSIVEASLDIDFDYIFTELQELNSLFQRLGRCNRKGVKDINNTNSFVYTKINNNGFTDETLFNLSRQALKSINGIITEKEKVKLIEDWLTTENLRDSNYLREYKEVYEFIDNIETYSIDKKAIKLRNILTIDIIPNIIYENNKELIENYIKELELDDLDNKYRLDLLDKIRDYVVSVPMYNKDYEKIKDLKLSKYEIIPVVKCIYDEKGFAPLKKDNKKVEFL